MFISKEEYQSLIKEHSEKDDLINAQRDLNDAFREENKQLEKVKEGLARRLVHEDTEKQQILSQLADLAFDHEALKRMYIKATKDYEGLLRLGYPPKS